MLTRVRRRVRYGDGWPVPVLAVPPPERVSVEPRRGDKFVPVPDPHLKSMPSVFASVSIESSESFTELMKHAEHWGLR